MFNAHLVPSFFLHRHIGGLEITQAERLTDETLHRHIGGLEKDAG